MKPRFSLYLTLIWMLIWCLSSCDLARIPSLTPPSANFSVDKTTCEAPCTITITNNSSNAVSYRWDFGNGEKSESQTPGKVSYTSPGIFKIQLIVFGEENTTDTLEQTISITQKGSLPIASFKVNSNGCTAPCDPGLDASGSLNNPSQFNWEIYDSNNSLTKTLSGATPNFTFEKAGQYRVKLSVNNNNGPDDTTQIVSIKGLTVLASLKLPEGKIFENCPVEFKNQSQNGLTYTWTVNNGVGSSTSTNPSFSFPKAGTYNITLTAKNGNISDDTVKTVQVFQFTGFNKPIALGSRRNHYDHASPTADGGHMLLGYSESSDINGDIILQKIDDQGNSIGSLKRIILNGRQDEHSFVQRPDGGFIIAGWSGVVGNEDAIIVQTDKDGNYESNKTITLQGSGREILLGIKKIPNNGGYILVGYTTSIERVGGNRGGVDILVVKLAEDGTKQWENTFGRGKDDYGIDVAIGTDGDFVVIIQSNSYKSNANDDYDVVLLKVNGANGQMSGTEIVIGNTDYEYGSKIINAIGGGFVVIGSSLKATTPVSGSIYFIKLRENLTIENEKIITFPSPPYYINASSITATPEGDYAIVGEVDKTSTSVRDAFFLKIAPDGSPRTTSPKFFGGSLIDRFNHILSIPGCGFLLVGEADLSTTTSPQKGSFFIVKVDSDGNL